ncbi:MAG TPA: Gfo/Idh/MocA family oxidoreductase [Bryobacteraceae bacterium]|nr:Gfo/Idh/MocA family oxidoreductase [Bryobacteraceae bacterium]
MSDSTKDSKGSMDRRDFLLATTAAAGATLGLGANPIRAASLASNEVRAGIIGAGAQGQVLLDAALQIPNVRFVAVCDIWTEYNQRRVSRLLADSGHPNHAYVDYKEFLDKEKDHLDAVLIATPDFWHAEHAIACMKAGLQVYCEKEMSNNLADARRMVQTARETGRLLQIGHQRRSNPRYQFCYQRLLTESKLLGRITVANGQWNRAKRDFQTIPARYNIKPEVLEKYGFSSMQQFLNWRWYRGLGGGPIVDLGSHQIDIFNWFMNARPSGVTASGGTDYYNKATHQWYDTVMAIFDYQTPLGAARAFYQTITTNGFGGYYEVFMGDQGALEISESAGRGSVYRDTANAPDWKSYVKDGLLTAPKEETKANTTAVLDVRETAPPPSYGLPVEMRKKYHQPHLENFFGAVRGRNKLNCPAEIGYETAVTVLKVNEAVEAQRRLEFKPEDFEV